MRASEPRFKPLLMNALAGTDLLAGIETRRWPETLLAFANSERLVDLWDADFSLAKTRSRTEPELRPFWPHINLWF